MKLLKEWAKVYRNWILQRKLQRIRKLVLQCAPNKIGAVGESPSGTIFKVKDVCFSLRRNTFYMEYTKLSRGQVNRIKGHRQQ